LYDLLNRNIVAIAGQGTGARAAAGPESSDASPVLGYVLLLVALVGSLAGLGMQVRHHAPFGVSGFGSFLGEPYRLVREEVDRSRLERLDSALQGWWLLHKETPEQLSSLVGAGLVDASDLDDLHGRPYAYTRVDAGYTLAVPEGDYSIERSLAP
jgi:hypothetical protein